MKDLLVIGGFALLLLQLAKKDVVATVPKAPLPASGANVPSDAGSHGVAIGEFSSGGGGGSLDFGGGGGYNPLGFNPLAPLQEHVNWVNSIQIGYPQLPPGVIYVPGTGGGSGGSHDGGHTRDYPVAGEGDLDPMMYLMN